MAQPEACPRPDGDLDQRRATDWVVRLFAAPGRSTLGVAVVLLVGLVGASWTFRIAVDGIAPAELPSNPYTYLDVLNAALFVYMAVALHLLRRGRIRDLDALRPALGGDEARFERVVAQAVDVPPSRLAWGGLVGAVLLGLMPIFDPDFWQGNPPPLLSLTMAFFALRSAATGWLVGHAVVSEAHGVTAYQRLGREEVRIDLLDLRPVAPIARTGFRSAVTWLLASSLVSLFWLGPAAGQTNAFIVGAILVLVALAFRTSLAGVHANIRAEKRRALDALKQAIRTRGEAALDGAADGPGPSVADLVALHGLVERVREWPLGAPAAARGALLALIALGSWGGAALVELVIERALAR